MPTNSLESFEPLQRHQYTKPFLFIPGKYTLSLAGQVPYFSAVMPLEDLVDEIKLVEDIPENVRLDWSLEELFQRDINWKRVKTELVDEYLKDPNKLSFFNALTVALLPQNDGGIEESYGQPESSSPVSYDTWEKIDIGNICVEYGPEKSIGTVRWHKTRVFPVAIDGQHRLAALKEYWKELKDNSVANSSEPQTKIPIIFLILDERVGFKERDKNPLTKTLREIFIDLNKNARSVPRSRVILLDDLDDQSRCVRTLLANNAKESSEQQLPLSMVTWMEDEAKFDSGYSITSVLNLKEIVGYCLDEPSYGYAAIDRLDESSIKHYIDGITAKLRLGEETKQSIKAHHELCIGRADPFSLTDAHLSAIQEAFRQQWAPHIIRVFHEFAPYKKFLSKARDIGAIGGLLRDYLLLPKEQRGKFGARKKAESETFNPRAELNLPLEELERLKQNEWAFYVVFQKALFLNFFQLEKHQRFPLADEPKLSREDFLTKWLDHMNALYERGVFNLHWKSEKEDLWKGIAKNPVSGTIQYSKAAANRISAFMTLCFGLNLGAEQSDAKAFATRLMEKANKDLPKFIRGDFNRVRHGLESLVKAQMNNDDEIDDKKLLAKKVQEELVKRFREAQV